MASVKNIGASYHVMLSVVAVVQAAWWPVGRKLSQPSHVMRVMAVGLSSLLLLLQLCSNCQNRLKLCTEVFNFITLLLIRAACMQRQG